MLPLRWLVTFREGTEMDVGKHARAAGHVHLAERLDTVVDQEKTMR